MSSTPTDLLQLNGSDTTVILGYRGTPGLTGLDPLMRTQTLSGDEVMHSLSWLHTDPVQRLKLRDFLANGSPAQTPPTTNYSINYNAHAAQSAAGVHVHDPVLAQLRHHLATGRIRALRLRRHARIERARPTVSTGQAAPVSDPGRAKIAVAAGIAGWSATERVEALFEDSLPFLNQDLRHELAALLSAKGLAETAGMMIALAAVQAIPVVGEALDAALMGIVFVYAGFSGLRAIARLMVLVRDTLKARSAAEIEALAPDAAKAIETLGSACLLALGARWKGRSPDVAGGVPSGGVAEADVVPASQEVLGPSPYPLPTTRAIVVTADGQHPSLSAKPAGKAFDGTVYRYEDPDRVATTFTAHPGNIAADHRYSGRGMGAVYGATSPETALAEVQHYDAEAGRVIVEKNVSSPNILDLTDANTRDSLGIDLDQITGNDYTITQQIGKNALDSGYDGILAPSARAPGSNLVLFHR